MKTKCNKLRLIIATIFTLLSSAAAHGYTIDITSTNFPDANFRNWLLEQDYGKDGKLTEDEIKNVTWIYVCNENISSLQGIEYFTSLTSLRCYSNQLTSLDVSKNTALAYLDCYSNQLTSLDVSKNTALIVLFCHSNQLTSLDVSKNTALKYLYCYRNQIKGASMDALIQSLPTTSTNPDFRLIDNSEGDEGNECTKSQVAAAKAKGWTPLYYNGSEWVEYEGSENTVVTKGIDITSTNFPDANFRNWLLKQYYGKDGKLTEDEIKNVTWINVGNENISSLKGIEYFTSLTSLLCIYNQLTSLDVSKNTALTYLGCGGNQLTSLDVSKNTALTDLRCNSNQLTSLDVSKNTALTSLSCGSNPLTSLDVSKNTALIYLFCSRNQIRGASMDALIQSLPTTSTNPTFRLIDNSEGDEGNECTKSQVAAAKAKGWTPLYYNGSNWMEYEGSEDPSPSIGSGTENDPFSPAAANEFASSLGADIPTEQVYYVKGKVASIKEQFGTQYGNATFYISDDGTTANQFYIYKAKYLGNKKYAGEDLVLNVGDEVVVCGKLVNYIGTLPGTVQDEAYVVSINGTKGSTHERGDVNGDGVVNIADLMMLVNILTGK